MTKPGALVAWIAACIAGLLVLALPGCGGSELRKAYDAYLPALSARLEDENRFWTRVAERAEDQRDDRGVAKYRSLLESEATKYYRDFDAAVQALRPGHARLSAVAVEVAEYARLRREFVDREIRRLQLMARADVVANVEKVNELQLAVATAHQEYMFRLGDEAPDARLAQLDAMKTAYLTGSLQRAVEGGIEASEAKAALDKDLLPKLQKLRNDRFDDTPEALAFRALVVKTEEFFQALSAELPVFVEGIRSTKGTQSLLSEAEAHRKVFQKLLADVKRDF